MAWRFDPIRSSGVRGLVEEGRHRRKLLSPQGERVLMGLIADSDPEHGAGDRSRALAHRAAVIARLYDPLSAGGPSGDHADMVRPHDHGADPGATRTSPMTPVRGEVVLRAAAFLRPHPPAAPTRRPRTNAGAGRARAMAAARVLHVMARARGRRIVPAPPGRRRVPAAVGRRIMPAGVTSATRRLPQSRGPMT